MPAEQRNNVVVAIVVYINLQPRECARRFLEAGGVDRVAEHVAVVGSEGKAPAHPRRAGLRAQPGGAKAGRGPAARPGRPAEHGVAAASLGR